MLYITLKASLMASLRAIFFNGTFATSACKIPLLKQWCHEGWGGRKMLLCNNLELLKQRTLY